MSGSSRPSTTSSAARVRTTTSSRGSHSVPCRKRTASSTSTALPQVRPSTWFMSVIHAHVFRPELAATSTRAEAMARAKFESVANAPLPTLMSSTMASRPAASFFERIEAQMSGIDSTVAVTSRIA